MARALLVRWPITIAGLLMSLVFAAIVVTQVPVQYTSSGTAVLVQPKLYGTGPGGSNPLLNFDASLSTTALIVVQSLNNKGAQTQLGMGSGSTDSYTIDDVSDGDSASASSSQFVQPFIYVTAKSATPAGAVAMVDRVFDKATQDLADRQRAKRVPTQNAITLDNVVGTADPKAALTMPAAAFGAALLLGLCFTFLTVLVRERLAGRAKAGVDGRVKAGGEVNPTPSSGAERPAVGIALNGAPERSAPELAGAPGGTPATNGSSVAASNGGVM